MIELNGNARIGHFELISRLDEDIPGPVLPERPVPLAGESVEDFEARAKVFADAAEQIVEAWRRDMRAARETGDYAAVLRPNANPTIFVCRQIPDETWRAYLEHADREDLSSLRRSALLVRIALVEVKGPWLPGFRVPKPAAHTTRDRATGAVIFTDLGDIAPPSLVSSFYAIKGGAQVADALIEDLGSMIANHRLHSGN